MEKIEKLVNFNKGGKGGHTARIILKSSWIKDMGLNKDDNLVTMEYDEQSKTILIKKLAK